MLIDDHFQALARQPDMGRGRPELAPDFAAFQLDKYVIFYVPPAKAVDLFRVLHGARDIESILQERLMMGYAQRTFYRNKPSSHNPSILKSAPTHADTVPGTLL